jgi:hypothetical protein
MVAEYDMNISTGYTHSIVYRLFTPKTKITQYVQSIINPNSLVDSVEYNLIHYVNIIKRAIAILYYIIVTLVSPKANQSEYQM